MDIVTKLVIFAIGFLLGALVAAIFASAGRRGLAERMATMRNCSGKQDDAIRKKEARIANLEKEIRRMRRKEK